MSPHIDLIVISYISFILETERIKIESMSVICMPVSDVNHPKLSQ